jgi:hypothetical protein
MDICESFIYGSFDPTKKSSFVGNTKRSKNTKTMAITDSSILSAADIQRAALYELMIF